MQHDPGTFGDRAAAVGADAAHSRRRRERHDDGEAQAARRVTPNPIRAAIRRSGLAVDLVDFSAPPRTSGAGPTRCSISLSRRRRLGPPVRQRHSRQAVADRPPHGSCRLFLDLRASPRPALAASPARRWDSAASPSTRISRAGAAGPSEALHDQHRDGRQPGGRTAVFDGPFRVDHHNVVAEWSVASGNPQQVRLDSRRELLRIGQYRIDHNADQLMFDPNLRPGDDRLRRDVHRRR